jgi:hypothetical protein
MLRQFLFPSVGALALLVVLGAPGQLHAQHMRGGSMMMGGQPSLRGMMPMMPMMGVQSSFRGMTSGVNRNVFVEPSFRGGFNDFRLHPTMPRNMAPLFNPTMPRGFTPVFNPAMPIFNPARPIFNPATPIFNQTMTSGFAPSVNPTRPSIFLP